ncbi:hypothetical protein MNBD_GAMMA01-2161 [hydrothermal vent metagenome]|uniref:Uncharacterized protein n=1 Tax=hydrothermal vent metagenome TaxID=652676 RepID=A0A3B0VXE0_9ZZZZ
MNLIITEVKKTVLLTCKKIGFMEEVTELQDLEMQHITVDKEVKEYEKSILKNRLADPSIDDHSFMIIGWREHLANEIKKLKREKAKKKNINKLVKSAISIQKTSAQDADALGFMARSFVLATMPHSKPKTNEFERINGDYKLNMWSPPSVGLPYGAAPRLFLAYITKQIKQTKSRDISLGDNLNQFMKELGLIPTGGRFGTITNLKAQIRKTLECSFRISNDSSQLKEGVRLDIADKYSLWWNQKDPRQRSIFPSTIRISEGFYNDVMENAIPLDMRVLKELKGSAFTLDIYMFLTHRLAYLKHETVIPYEVLFEVFGSNYKELKTFKFKFKKALQKQTLYTVLDKLLRACPQTRTTYMALELKKC